MAGNACECAARDVGVAGAESCATGCAEHAAFDLCPGGKDNLRVRLWHEMVRNLPDYEPARANLAILASFRRAWRRPAPSSAAAIVKASRDERDKHLPPGRSNDQSDNHAGGSNIHRIKGKANEEIRIGSLARRLQGQHKGIFFT
jgi:hypothetical protein